MTRDRGVAEVFQPRLDALTTSHYAVESGLPGPVGSVVLVRARKLQGDSHPCRRTGCVARLATLSDLLAPK
jgi:hypothetical protein